MLSLNKVLSFIFLILLGIFILHSNVFSQSYYWPVDSRPPFSNASESGRTSVISLENVRFDIHQGLPALPAELLYGFDNGEKDSIYIIHFNNLNWNRNRGILENLGVRFYQYIPNNAYCASIPASAYEQVLRQPFIDWAGLYHPLYKISPFIENMEFSGPEVQEMEVYFFDEASLEEVKSQIKSFGLEIHMEDLTPGSPSLRVFMSTAHILPVAFLEEIKWISPFRDPVPLNDTVPGIVQTNCPTNDASCRPLWYDHGVNGKGQLIGVCDTGLDHDNCGFADPVSPSLAREIGGSYLNSDKVPVYHVAPGGPTAYDFGGGGHGTAVSSVAAGDSSNNNETTYSEHMSGVAPESQIWFLDIGAGSSLVFNHGAWRAEMELMMDAGAAAINNSWGIDTYYGQYLGDDYKVDFVMWNKKSGVVTVAAGNSGPGTSLGSPANTKNGLCVGASNDYASTNSMWYGSSNGPTRDNRIKPDITAPGAPGSSSYIEAAFSDGNISSNNCNYSYGGAGTSYASPIIAGCVSLVHQYFSNGFYPSGSASTMDAFDPSDALLRAMIINSGQIMTGSWTGTPKRPGNAQGWGRVMLEDVLYFDGDQRKLFVLDYKSGLSDTSSDVVESIEVNSYNEPLRITLVWTDFPGDISRPTGKQLVNDLDLEVSMGVFNYAGNNFDNAGWSKPGGDPDDTNNVECVYLEAPAVGTYTIRIKPVNIPESPQPFALVISGDIGSPIIRPTPSPDPVQCLRNAVTIDGTIDAGEWTDAKSIYIDSGRSVEFPYYLYMKNDDNYLYLGMDAVGDTDDTGLHYSGIYFDAGVDHDLTTDSEDAIEVYSNGTVQYSLWNGGGWASFETSTNGVPFTGTSRNQAGLVAAYGFGASPNDSTPHYSYEVRVPLDLGDLSLAPTLDSAFYIYLLAQTKESYYPADTSWPDPATYALITLCGSMVPVDSTGIIILLIMSISLALPLMKR